jgi:Planctomycete extracellular
MSSRTANQHAQRTRLAVEQLEDRQLLSVTVTPAHINLKGTSHGNGVFHVRILSDSQLQSTSSLTLKVAQNGTSGTPPTITTIDLGTSLSLTTNPPVKVTSADVNGDGVSDLILKFRRSVLNKLTDGDATVTVSNGPTSESTTINLFTPGHQGHHDHHDNGHHHGHGKHGHNGGNG